MTSSTSNISDQTAAYATAYRQRVAALLVDAVREAGALACWEGGSAATGRLDGFSDIDLCVVAPLTQADAMFAAVEGALRSITAIEHTWVLDPAPCAATAQRFYLLRDAPPFFAIDCAVLSLEGIGQFLERERHGEPLVYFDTTGQVHATALDKEAHARRIARRREQIAQLTPVYALLVRKDLARGRPLEAFGFYQALVRALAELLGMRYRPERFDFGLRYVTTDFPTDAQALLANAMFVPDGDALPVRLDALLAAIAAELAAPHPFG
jgi:hypothetical protein